MNESNNNDLNLNLNNLFKGVESETEALERISSLLRVPKEEVPSQFVDMVMRGIDGFGPIVFLVTNVPRNPRKFTDEEILKYAPKELLEEHNRIIDKTLESLKPKEEVIPPGKWDMSMTEGIITEPSTGRLMNPPPMFGDKPTVVTVPPMFDGIPVKKPIDELKERHPDFFDENGELRQSAVEVIELLFQNYKEAKRQEQVQEKDEPQPQVPAVF